MKTNNICIKFDCIFLLPHYQAKKVKSFEILSIDIHYNKENHTLNY